MYHWSMINTIPKY